MVTSFDDATVVVLLALPAPEDRDHRMSLAEPVPFLRWRTTQLAKFELSWGLMHLMARKDNTEASKVVLVVVVVVVVVIMIIIALRQYI